MNVWRNLLMTLALVAAVCSLGRPAVSQPMSGPRPDSPPLLTVTGDGEVAAAPDRASVRLGAEAQANDAADAQAQVNAIMTRAIQQIRALNIDERKIQTTGLQLFPVYTNPGQNEAPRVSGYRASNSIQIEVNNLDQVGKVIDAGVAAGANRQEGVTFDLKSDTTARTEALQQAVTSARAKADAIATALGVRLGGVSDVVEGGASIAPPPRLMGAMYTSGVQAMSTPVQPGEMRVRASVTIRYHIAPPER